MSFQHCHLYGQDCQHLLLFATTLQLLQTVFNHIWFCLSKTEPYCTNHRFQNHHMELLLYPFIFCEIATRASMVRAKPDRGTEGKWPLYRK